MDQTVPDRSAALDAHPVDLSPIKVDRWPSETPLVLLVALVSLAVWAIATITIVGLLYAAVLGMFFFVGHAVFVAHVRGNGVRVGPEQFPELYVAVDRLSQRMGLAPVPDTYVLQAGGSLNAFAAKFFRSNIVVLFSDLLDACGEDERARDMIIAHELGHIRSGHLRWSWFLLPGSFVPFLGAALSRAREYTCDRYGAAGAGRRDSALAGLAILAAGGSYGPRVNREAMARQRDELNTGWMRIGEWLSTHPSLVNRMTALDPALDALAPSTSSGTVRGLGIIGAAVAAPVVAIVFATTIVVGFLGPIAARAAARERAGAGAGQAAAVRELVAAQTVRRAEAPASQSLLGTDTSPVEPLPLGANVAEELSRIQVSVDLTALAGVAEIEREKGSLPADADALYAKVAQRNPGEPERRDAFGGQRYRYEQGGGYYILRSAGPDSRIGTVDDIIRDSRRQ